MTDSLTRELLAQVLANRPTDDPAVLAAVRTLFLDHLGVTVWGARSRVAELMTEHVLADLDRRSPKTLAIIGTGHTASPTEAAMANAVAAASYEFDDTHTPASAHPGAVIFPAALAAAVIAGCDEHRFVAAVYAGYEVLCRVARALNPHAHRARHFHPTSTAGHFGAAAAAGVCLALDLDTSVTALSLAGTVAGGSMQFLVEGAITKQLHPAYAVQRGVQGALLARRGFPGLADPIAGTRGLLAAQSEDPRPDRLLAGLGSAPAEVTLTGVKPYPSCRNTQSAVGALRSVLADHPVDPHHIDSITIGMIGPGLTTVWEPPNRTRRPRTLADAQFSMPFVAAVTILDGELGTAQFDPQRYADPAVTALMDRVQCVGDPALDARYPASWPAWVEIRMHDGTVLHGRAEHPRGDPTNPLSNEEIVAKFDDLTRLTYSQDRRDALTDAVYRLPQSGALTELLALVSGDDVLTASPPRR